MISFALLKKSWFEGDTIRSMSLATDIKLLAKSRDNGNVSSKKKYRKELLISSYRLE